MTHQDLKEAAMKATPGPWHENKNAVNDIAYVALANPTRILSLIEENERMREALTAMIALAEKSALPIAVLSQARAALKEKPHD